jgi:hypothetical protein
MILSSVISTQAPLPMIPTKVGIHSTLACNKGMNANYGGFLTIKPIEFDGLRAPSLLSCLNYVKKNRFFLHITNHMIKKLTFFYTSEDCMLPFYIYSNCSKITIIEQKTVLLLKKRLY